MMVHGIGIRCRCFECEEWVAQQVGVVCWEHRLQTEQFTVYCRIVVFGIGRRFGHHDFYEPLYRLDDPAES